MKKLILINLILVLLVIVGAIYFFTSPQVYPLSCRVYNFDLNGGVIDSNLIFMNEECQSNEDCKGVLWKYNCGIENSCSNEVIECINNKCEKVVYFDLFASCV